MRKLRTEMHRRMLGNGYCARPVEMDCHFESICESCSFFVTTIEFRPTLQRQRDDAASKGQIGRQKIFDGILDRLDADASDIPTLDRITRISTTPGGSNKASTGARPTSTRPLGTPGGINTDRLPSNPKGPDPDSRVSGKPGEVHGHG